MMVEASKVRYLKLGAGGIWEQPCKDGNVMRVGLSTGHPLTMQWAKAGAWDKIAQDWRENGHSASVATRYTNEIREYFEDDGTTLWVTFINGSLHYAFLQPGSPTALDDESSFRPVQGEWRNVDLKEGKVLAKSNLSGTYTNLASYRGTSCWVPDPQRLVARINGIASPAVLRVQQAQQALVESGVGLLKMLGPKPMEILSDMLFTAAGWRRTGGVGGTTKAFDFYLEHPLTNELAVVQVKASASQKELDEFVDSFNAAQVYTRGFFLHHSSPKPLSTADERVYLMNAEAITEQVIELGFMRWLIEENS